MLKYNMMLAIRLHYPYFNMARINRYSDSNNG